MKNVGYHAIPPGCWGCNYKTMISNKEGACKCSKVMSGRSVISRGSIEWEASGVLMRNIHLYDIPPGFRGFNNRTTIFDKKGHASVPLWLR